MVPHLSVVPFDSPEIPYLVPGVSRRKPDSPITRRCRDVAGGATGVEPTRVADRRGPSLECLVKRHPQIVSAIRAQWRFPDAVVVDAACYAFGQGWRWTLDGRAARLPNRWLWLRRVGLNRAYRLSVSSGRRAGQVATADPVPLPARRRRRPTETAGGDLPLIPCRPERMLDEATWTALCVAIAGLPPDLERLVVCRYWDGMTHLALAERFGVSVRAVRFRLDRAYRLLRRSLAVEGISGF